MPDRIIDTFRKSPGRDSAGSCNGIEIVFPHMFRRNPVHARIFHSRYLRSDGESRQAGVVFNILETTIYCGFKYMFDFSMFHFQSTI